MDERRYSTRSHGTNLLRERWNSVLIHMSIESNYFCLTNFSTRTSSSKCMCKK